MGTAAVTYLYLQEYYEDELYSPIAPVLFAGVLAFYVASSFAGLLGMVSETTGLAAGREATSPVPPPRLA